MTIEQPDAQRTRAELSELLQRYPPSCLMTAVQVAAFVFAVCLLAGCVRIASTWLSPVFARIASGMLEHAVLALATAAVLLLVPAGVYLALGRD